MVNVTKILVRAERHGLSKTWVWDTSTPLWMRRPVTGRIRRQGEDIYFENSRLGKMGEPMDYRAGPSSLKLVPLSLPLVGTTTSSVRSLSDNRRVLGSLLISLLLTLGIGFQFGDSMLSPKPVVNVEPLREMRVQSLPARVPLPQAAPMKVEVDSPPTSLPLPSRVGGSSRGSEGGSGTNSAQVLRQAFGNLLKGNGPIGKGAFQLGREGTGGGAGDGRESFGFGKGGPAPAVGGTGPGSAGALQRFGESYGEGVLDSPKIGRIDGAKVEGQGYAPILIDTENLSVGQGLLPQEVHGIIQARIHEVRRCQETSARGGKSYQGKVLVKFRILGDGRVASPSLSGTGGLDSRLKQCLIQRMTLWGFPAPRGGQEVEVSYPFVFLTVEGESP